MLLFLVRRLTQGAAVLVATAFFAYGGIRLLRPELNPGEPWLSGTWSDMTRALLHLDFGESCMYVGCPSLHDLWVRGIRADVALLAGGLGIGVVAGVAAGKWCAAHPGSPVRRVVEALAMLFFCAPVYVVGFTLLLLFDPTFGLVPVRAIFSPHTYQEPYSGLVDDVRALLLPWLVVSLPVAAAALRLTIGMTQEAVEEDYMRTALAKGLSREQAVRRHAAPAAYASVASYVGAVVPSFVLNMVLVEFVFSVPGFFVHTWRAFGKAPGFPHEFDYPTLQAIGLWAAVFIVFVGIAADLALVALDPRIRARGRLG